MLQQTQVATVIPYYQRFLAAFPTVKALAAAPREDVLKLWEGLGYYARARYLHRAAQLINERFGGQIPATEKELLALPGIGEYTARALLAIGFEQPFVAMDANVWRIFARVFWLPQGGRTPEERRRGEELAAKAVPSLRVGDFNQALMDLGALVCTPRAPRCAECPLADLCAAYEQGCPEAVPQRPAKRSTNVIAAAAYLKRGGKILLAQRPPEGLWGGLWELPATSIPPEAEAPVVLATYLREAFGLVVHVGDEILCERYAVAQRSVQLRVFAAALLGGRLCPRQHSQARWLTPAEAKELPVPAPHRRVLTTLFTAAWEN